MQLDYDVAVLARRLIREFRMKTPNDAVHLATALVHNLDEFHTYDRWGLLPPDGKLVRADGLWLKICTPPPPTQS